MDLSTPPPAPILQAERFVPPISFPDPALERALRGFLFPKGSGSVACHHLGGARYIFNRVDLDGDRQPETLVALLGQRRCDQEGCPLLLLRSVGAGLVPLQRIAGLRSSLLVSERRSHGWLDLILPATATTEDGPPLRLTHNGTRYLAPSEQGFGDTKASGQATRGVSALVLRPSPYLVQGHPLPCSPSRLNGP